MKPQPPESVVNAVKALRADFDRIHIMEDDEAGEYAYRQHDEHNADVREDIEVGASVLIRALEEWLEL